MKKKAIIFVGLFLVFLIVFCFSNKTVKADGIVSKNGTEKQVSMTLKLNRFYKLLGKTSGEITVDYGTYDETYKVSGSIWDIYKDKGVFISFVTGFTVMDGESEPVLGRIYFDENLENIVITADIMEWHFAEEAFIEKVYDIGVGK